MVFTPDLALKRAIKFFIEKGKTNQVDIGRMPLYYDNQTDRMFVNVFLASHVQSKKPFRFNEAGIYDWISDFAHKPIVLFKKGEHFDHPLIASASKALNMQFQDTKKVGEVLLPFDKPDDKGTWRGIGELTVNKVKDFLRSLNTDELPMFTSPQVAYSGDDYDIKMAQPMHLALTDYPAYPPEMSMITGVCEGEQSACYQKLAAATANKFEAGEQCFVCFADAMQDLVFNNAVKSNDNSYLKISNFSNKPDMPDDINKQDDSTAQTDQVNKIKSPAGIADEVIKQKANDAVSAMVEDINKRIAIVKDGTVKVDPKSIMDNAIEPKKTAADEPKPYNIEEDPKYKALLSEVDSMKADKRKESIAKVIPLALVTDIKSGGVNDKLLNEFVDYWINTNQSPEQIAEYYTKQMSQLEAVQKANIPKAGKASGFSDNELASKITDSEPQFDAPDVDNSTDNEKKIAGASANADEPWFLNFAGMLVSNVSKNNEGKGSAKRLID